MNLKTYHLITYGCQMNKSDSERIVSVLESVGFKKVPNKTKADLIIINACSVRQSAIDRIWGLLSNNKKPFDFAQGRQITNNKTKKQFTILTGCILEEDKKKFEKRVDLIFNISDLEKLPELLSVAPTFPVPCERSEFTGRSDNETTSYHQLREAKDRANDNKLPCNDYFHLTPKYSSKFSAFVPIMTGCNNFCSYCVVPYTRGSERSREVEEILQEVKGLVKKGYKEIILLGQNVNSYKSFSISFGKDLREINFPKLLKIINDIPGNFWIRFITSHPKDLSDDLIKAMAECEKICEYLHLPIQSGSDKILKKMNRGYTTRHYLNLVNKIRKQFANIRKSISVSTDVIIGFPGETTDDFKETAEMMKKIKFDMAYIAKYSPRPGTTAYKLKDNVPKQEKKRREKILTKILEKTALENNKNYVRKTVDVLVEANVAPTSVGDPTLKSGPQSMYYGRTRTFKHVKINVAPAFRQEKIIGQFVKVKITGAGPWGLEGNLLPGFSRGFPTLRSEKFINKKALINQGRPSTKVG